MHRSLLPSILASLAYVTVLLATSIPLFEWQISNIATNFPSTYEVHMAPYLLTTRLGEALDNGSYIGKVYASKGSAICHYGDLNFVATRSHNDEALERMSLNVNRKYIPWLVEWNMIEIYLSGIYIWWFAIWYRHSIWKAAGLTGLAVFIFLFLTQIMRPFLWRVGPSPEYFGKLDCYYGTITFNIGLSKLHYETLIVLFVGILLELGALGVMVRQIIRAVIERKRVPN